METIQVTRAIWKQVQSFLVNACTYLFVRNFFSLKVGLKKQHVYKRSLFKLLYYQLMSFNFLQGSTVNQTEFSRINVITYF